MQRDEKYYEEPDNFDPERFYGENVDELIQLGKPFIPFGGGPRICIGMTLAKLEAKTGAILMLQKYRFELSDMLKRHELKFDPKMVLLAPRNDIPLRVLRR